jgi:hypothetical protein
MLIFALSLLLSGPSQDAVTLPAWIVSLHAYERSNGRDQWSWTELTQARASVSDPHWSQPPVPSWWKQLYTIYLQYFPLFFLLLTLLGLVLCGWCYTHRRVRICFLLALGWFILAITGWYLVHPLHASLVVIKQPAVLLRTGNGITYAPVVMDGQAVQLTAGVEAEYRSERDNGWVQLELKNNILGWVPKDAVYISK